MAYPGFRVGLNQGVGGHARGGTLATTSAKGCVTQQAGIAYAL